MECRYWFQHGHRKVAPRGGRVSDRARFSQSDPNASRHHLPDGCRAPEPTNHQFPSLVFLSFESVSYQGAPDFGFGTCAHCASVLHTKTSTWPLATSRVARNYPCDSGRDGILDGIGSRPTGMHAYQLEEDGAAPGTATTSAFRSTSGVIGERSREY